MNVRVSLGQMAVSKGSPETNLKRAEIMIQEASGRGSHIICLPEMWTTGFDWSYISAPKIGHEVVMNRVSHLASKYKIWINGSMPLHDSFGGLTNASVLFDPAGSVVGIYRKTHLFTLMNEDAYLKPGNQLGVVDAPWGKTGLCICYDLRFPELIRTYALRGAKVVILSAAFPYPRLEHWRILIRARAIENQLFVIAVNQAGVQAIDNEEVCFGCSAIIDPWGETIIEAPEREESIVTADINTDYTEEVKSKMRVFADRRPDIYEC